MARRQLRRRLLLLSCLQLASAQFRGGSISWEPVSFAKCEGGQAHEGGRCEGANVVRFTLRTAWTRTGGTFVKVVDGIASPADNYQPVSGDTVKVTGREAPKFLVSSGEEFLLEVKVTSNTAQTPGTNDPQEHGHWTYSSTNWIEGTSEYLVTLPRTDITYVAELHGCCREKRDIENTRHSRGITHMFESAYHLQASVRLDRQPPPLSFIPAFVPLYVGRDLNPPRFLDVPVLDYRATVRSAPSRVVPHDGEAWPAKVLRARLEQQGTVMSLAPGAQTPETDLLSQDKSFNTLAGSELDEADRTRPKQEIQMRDILMPADDDASLHTLPPLPPPQAVVASVSGTGTSVRMIARTGEAIPSYRLRLFHDDGCLHALDSVEVSCDVDLCEDGNPLAPAHYPQGGGRVPGRVRGNFSSVMVPAGLALELSPRCEFSSPPAAGERGVSAEDVFATDASLAGALVPAGCDNTLGNASLCCRVASPQAVQEARTLRCRAPIPGYSVGKTVAADVQMQHTLLPDRRLQIRLYPQALAVGNFPVQLRFAAADSCYTTAEFVLHLMKDSVVEAFGPAEGDDAYAQQTVTAGFPAVTAWHADADASKKEYAIFDNMHAFTFGDTSPVAAVRGRGSGLLRWQVEWVSAPCEGSVGMYFYCFHGVLASSPYDWMSIQCKIIRVVEDLPPVLAFYDAAEAAHNERYRSAPRSRFSVFMGQRLEVVVEARDNGQDTIDFLKLSKVDINTGDRLRASIHLVSTQVGELDNIPSLWYAAAEVVSLPVLEEVVPPPYVSLTAGGPVRRTFNLSANFSAEAARNRVLSYVPTRMHSGLEMSVCVMAGDSRGLCRPIGDATQRCMRIAVHRCRYAMQAGEELMYVAGLFEMDWLQMWALNPTYLQPEVPVASGSDDTIVRIGQLYTAQAGEHVFNIAREFGMTVKQIMYYNADFSRQKMAAWTAGFPPGGVLCVVPNSCHTNV